MLLRVCKINKYTEKVKLARVKTKYMKVIKANKKHINY